MKIYQITGTKSYNRYQTQNRSTNVYNQTYTNDPYKYNSSFKGSLGQTIKNTAKKVLDDTIDGISRSADKIQQNYVDPIYKRIFDRTTKSVKPEKIEKAVIPATKKIADSIIPQPNFSMDYEKVLDDLQTVAVIDAKWLKSNKPVLKAATGYKDEQMNERFFNILVAEINRNRKSYINEVKNLHAKEKAEYINSIWDEFLDIRPPFKPMDKEKSILGLKALQQFGTREDLLKLHPRYQLSKDSDIMKEYAKLANKVGESIDCLPLMSKLGTKDIAYEESTLAEIMKALKTLMVDRTEPNTWLNFSYQSYRDFERLATHPNKVISENAKAIMKRISDENKWMLE